MGITADNLEPGVEFEDVIGFLTAALPLQKKGEWYYLFKVYEITMIALKE